MKHLKALAGAALLAVSGPAAADNLTFESLARDGQGVQILGSPLTIGDYVFSASYGGDTAFLIYDRDNVQNADRGGATVVYRYESHPMWMSRADGQAFDLTSIDIADIFNGGARATNDLFFDFGNGRIETLTFTTDTLRGLETLLLNANGLQRFGLAARSSSWWQFDNVVVSRAAGPSAVPEPATWALMLTGFGTIGASMRVRRRRRVLRTAIA